MLAYVHRGDPLPTRRSGPTFEAAERKLLEAARAEADIQATLLWTGSSSVGRGLHELAERHRVDLVVLGSCGRAGLGRAAIGDHTRDALSGAPCAVAIAPAGYAQQPSMMRKIGVGYRGSPEGSHARAVARELATELEARCRRCAVSVPLDRASAGALDQLVEDARERIAELGEVEPHPALRRPCGGTHALRHLRGLADRGIARVSANRAPHAWRHVAAPCTLSPSTDCCARPDRR